MFDVQEYKYGKYILIQNIITGIFLLANNTHNVLHLIAEEYYSSGLLVFNILQIFFIAALILRKKDYRAASEHMFFFAVTASLISLNAFEKNLFYRNNLVIAYPIILSMVFSRKRNTLIYGTIIIASTVYFQLFYRIYVPREFFPLLLALSVVVVSVFIYKMFVDKLEYLQENTASEIFNSTLIVLGRVAELKDKETHSHLERVGIIVEMLLRKMKHKSDYSAIISEEYIKTVTQASILHDIGKIAVNDNILMKKGPLTPEEYDEIKLHTIAGEQLIREVQNTISNKRIFFHAIDISKYHHERWDGMGYPDGLKGPVIPLPARIMAVADVFDALLSERPYKRPYSLKEASAVILSEAGGQFDPGIVGCFEKIYKDIYGKLKNHL